MHFNSNSMSTKKYIDDDFVKVHVEPDSKSHSEGSATFGDEIKILEVNNDWTTVEFVNRYGNWAKGFIKGNFNTRDTGILKFSMVDVQQGDGMVVETPEGKILLIDGGDNKLFARHVAARFKHRKSTAASPLEIEAIIITHGDADHFDGLSEIKRSEDAKEERKRLFAYPKRVFHNGLLKRPTKVDDHKLSDHEMFGRTGTLVGTEEAAVIDLYDNFLDAPTHAMNKPFNVWRETLKHWQKRKGSPIDIKRLAFGMNEAEIFDFLGEEGITVELQGPFEERTTDPVTGQLVQALPFFHTPPKSAELSLSNGESRMGSISASHTINGHSLAFRLTYGNVRFNFTGDMNKESMALTASRIPSSDLEAEIIKAPHHGSHDFDMTALKAMRPVVALVSSGDDSAAKEYIHPRATLMSALGQAMRGPDGIVLTTELTAFFAYQDECFRKEDIVKYFALQGDIQYDAKALKKLFASATIKARKSSKNGYAELNSFAGFERYNFGIINVRTDGERVLVFTYSAEQGAYEAYRFTVKMEGAQRIVKFAPRVTTKG
jgi:hypothetical protein